MELKIVDESELKRRLRWLAIKPENIDQITLEIKERIDLDGKKIKRCVLDAIIDEILADVRVGDQSLFEFGLGKDNMPDLLVQK